jgi:hypothetical protein
MLNDGNIPLGQEPWELSVRNWLAYAAGELQCTFGNEVARCKVYVFNEISLDSVGNFEEIGIQIKVTINSNYECPTKSLLI